jgi:hypothetical protein
VRVAGHALGPSLRPAADVTGGYRLLFTALAVTYLTTALILLFFVRQSSPPSDMPANAMTIP